MSQKINIEIIVCIVSEVQWNLEHKITTAFIVYVLECSASNIWDNCKSNDRCPLGEIPTSDHSLMSD